MPEMSRVLKKIAKKQRQYDIDNGHAKGYWLVRSSDKERFYIDEYINPAALERVADKVLNDRHGYDYWIDYCLGLDVNGAVAWSNLDHSDRFLDCV